MIAYPRPAHWFQLAVAWEDLPQAINLLGKLQTIELEIDPSATMLSFCSPQLTQLLDQFQILENTYQSLWPKKLPDITPLREQFAVRVTKSVQQLVNWQAEVDPIIAKLRALQGRVNDLECYLELLTAMQG